MSELKTILIGDDGKEITEEQAMSFFSDIIEPGRHYKDFQTRDCKNEFFVEGSFTLDELKIIVLLAEMFSKTREG